MTNNEIIEAIALKISSASDKLLIMLADRLHERADADLNNYLAQLEISMGQLSLWADYLNDMIFDPEEHRDEIENYIRLYEKNRTVKKVHV